MTQSSGKLDETKILKKPGIFLKNEEMKDDRDKDYGIASVICRRGVAVVREGWWTSREIL